MARFYAEGSGFDVASKGELDIVRGLGVPSDAILFGNTIKTSASVRDAYDYGVSLFAADCPEELKKIATNAPGASVQIRLRAPATPNGSDVAWSSGAKFGVHQGEAVPLLRRAADLGLVPAGISLNVGSQQTSLNVWREAIASGFRLLADARAAGLPSNLLNLGGGFPAAYSPTSDPLPLVCGAATQAVEDGCRTYGFRPRILAEPGRALTAHAGALVASTVLATTKDAARWILIDAGVWRGLIETFGETIRYPILAPRKCGKLVPAVIAGMTCDSLDVVYREASCLVPESLGEGDRLVFLGAGAYSSSYSSVAFNGLPPPDVIIAE